MSRIIAHLDMDAFFASVEELDKPYLRGLPVAVGADPKGGDGRGVVATANYAARAYGIHSALPIARAWKLSEAARKAGKPAVAFLSPRFHRYQELSDAVMATARRYARALQQTSVDEAYADFSSYQSFRKAEIAAKKLKTEIRASMGLSCSIGIGHNRMMAKIAANAQKPDGLTVILPSRAEQFLENLPVRVIPGIGKKTEELLKRKGIVLVRDVKTRSWEELSSWLGSHGFDLYQRVRGVGSANVAVVDEAGRKSISEDETFESDTLDFKFLTRKLEVLAQDVAARLDRKHFRGFQTVSIIVRFEDFETKTRSLTVKEILSTAAQLERKGLKLLLPFFERTENPRKKKIRMLGLRVEKLI